MTLPEPPSPTPRQSTPSEPRGPRIGRLTLLAMLLLLAAIGTWVFFLRPKPGSEGGPRANPSPTTTAPSTPTPTINPQASDDLNTAFRAIYAKRTQATVEGRPEIVDEIYQQDCECYELRSMIEEGIRRGGHYVGYNPAILLIRELTQGFARGPNLATVRVITQQDPYKVEGSNGQLITTEQGWGPQSSAWTLVRGGPQQPWKVSFLLVEGPADNVLGPDWRESAQ